MATFGQTVIFTIDLPSRVMDARGPGLPHVFEELGAEVIGLIPRRE